MNPNFHSSNERIKLTQLELILTQSPIEKNAPSHLQLILQRLNYLKQCTQT